MGSGKLWGYKQVNTARHESVKTEGALDRVGRCV